MSIPSRADTVAKIHAQMNDDRSPQQKGAIHYGYVELRELMDFIYGGKPTSDAEKLIR